MEVPRIPEDHPEHGFVGKPARRIRKSLKHAVGQCDQDCWPKASGYEARNQERSKGGRWIRKTITSAARTPKLEPRLRVKGESLQCIAHLHTTPAHRPDAQYWHLPRHSKLKVRPKSWLVSLVKAVTLPAATTGRQARLQKKHLKAGIAEVRIDRSGCRYHARQSSAEAGVKPGLKF
ncbi:hypothetical protein FQR65_LT20289 [Abscondita terminalis]|nr:hypothetical protein FQR65_LT20289 [Abscondita terminalis]